MLTKKEKRLAIMISDVTMQMISYLELAQAYVEAKYYSPEIVHIGKLISKMQEIIEPLTQEVEPARFLIKRTKNSACQIYIKNPLEK